VNSKADLVLGYDFGTSSVKAALFDRNGRVVADSQQPYPLLLPQPGWAEQKPEDWWRAMAAATRALLAKAQAAPERIAALGMSAQMCGTIPVDCDGGPLHNCLIWLDTRSDGIARRITAGGPRIAGYGIFRLLRWLYLTNGAPNLSGKDPASKILWLRENEPEIWTRAHKLLDVKDWLLHRCCGSFVTSEDCAHLTWLMDTRKGRRGWSRTLLGQADLDQDRLPRIMHATQQAGTLTAIAAAHLGLATGTPVAVGTGDVNACAVAAGDLTPGVYHIHLGTSMWLGTHTRGRRVDPMTGIATICGAAPDACFLVATQESAGAAAGWAARSLGFAGPDNNGLAALNDAAAQTPPAQDAPYFFPWLYGERVLADDKFLCGGFAGASLEHGRGALARAVLEGVGLNTRWALQYAARLGGPAEHGIRIMGGAARSDLWCQILADVLQTPVDRTDRPELGGALGAAVVASVAAGWFDNLDSAARMAAAPQYRRFEPDAGAAALYRHRFARFLDYHRRVRRWHRRAVD